MDSTPPPREEAQPEDGSTESPMDALRSAAMHFGEAKEFAATFIAAKADSAKLSLRRALFMTAFFVIAAVTGTATVVTAAVLLTAGIASAIGQLFDPPKPWVGQIIVGAAVLVATNLGVYLLIRNAMRASRKRTVQKYEDRHKRQRSQFGRDVSTAASDVAAG
ncbi:hypothetical protein BH09PLA1_BH09PLA1_19410 [soil metagenome]